MNYLSEIIYISMILDFIKLVNGSSLSLPARAKIIKIQILSKCSWLGDRDSVTYLSSVNSLRSLTSESTLPPLLRFAQSALFSSLSQQKQPQNLKTLWLFSWLGDRDSNPDFCIQSATSYH